MTSWASRETDNTHMDKYLRSFQTDKSYETKKNRMLGKIGMGRLL